jgi:hypothetical protein
MPSKNNGHNGTGSGVYPITPQFVIPDSMRSSSKQVRCLDSESTEQEAVEFRQFLDGTLVELVRDPSKPWLRFLVWKNGRTGIQDNFQHADRLFVPPVVAPSLISVVRLPTALKPHGGLEDLVRRVQECISTYVDLEPQDVRLTTNIILHSWFADCSTVTPYLWVTGPCG